MNDELKTKEYFKSMENIKLSDSSRERIKDDLLQYARFHAVPSEVVPVSTPIYINFWRTLSRPAPAAFVMLLLVGTTTSLLAEEAAPGDFLYAIKTNVNERFGSVFATRTKDNVEAPTGITEPQPVDVILAQTDEVSSDSKLAKNDKTSKNTETNKTFAINARTKVLLETAVDDKSSDLVTMLSQGTISVGEYTSDLKLRDKNLRDLVKKYDAELETNVKNVFKTKLDSATTLTAQSEGKSETDARANLDKASVLIGEVEAELSTLGQVIVKDGLIVDIDFSVDMSIPHTNGESAEGDTTNIETEVEETLDVTSGLEL